MNQQDLFEFHEAMTGKALRLCKRKNNDYASGGTAGENPFANFSRVEDMGITSTEQGFLVRMTDKMSRLSTFTKAGKLEVSDESVEDTLLDLINYSVLFAAYLHQKRESND
jgi:hypothetical protein